MKKIIKILKYSIISVISIIGFVLIYIAIAFGLSRISTKKEIVADANIPIYILSNGVHTDIVVPAHYDKINWTTEVKYSNTKAQDTSAQWLAFGWGDKGFYLDTPTWADLKFSTAFKAAFGLSTSALHTTYYKSLNESQNCKKLMLNKTQYSNLTNYIKNSFLLDKSGKSIFINTKAIYGQNDAFYEGVGKYSLFHTCNTWANNALKSCGQKACLWTANDKGIFYHYQ